MERLPERHRKTTGRSPAPDGTWSFSSARKFSLRRPSDVFHSMYTTSRPRLDKSGTPTNRHSASVRTSTRTACGLSLSSFQASQRRDISCVAHPRESRIFSARRDLSGAVAGWPDTSGRGGQRHHVSAGVPDRPKTEIAFRHTAAPRSAHRRWPADRPRRSGFITRAAAGDIIMVSTGKPRMARACSSNAESRWLRSVTQALGCGHAVTSAKYTSSPLIINSTLNTPRPPSALTMRAAIDLAASAAAGLSCCGCQDSARAGRRDGRWVSRTRSPDRPGRRCGRRAG